MEDEIKKAQERAKKLAELNKLDAIDFPEIEKKIKEWMVVDDPYIIRLICAVVLTNSFSDKGIWMMLIAPSGGGKSALLSGLSFLEEIYEISSLTPQTLLSGMPGRSEASLLPRISGKVMIFKDWTTIMSLHKDAQMEIISQLREIWDGKLVKVFGNGKTMRWEGKVSLLCASTQMVDLFQQRFTSLGERFLNYRIIMPEGKDAGRRALRNRARQNEMEWEIQKAFFAFFKWIKEQKSSALPALSEDINQSLIDLAELVVKARSGVIREYSYRQEIVFVPAAELPTRILQQLAGLTAASMILNGGVLKDEDLKMTFKTALDSIPQTNYMVLHQLAQGVNQTTKEIAIALGYPTSPIHRYLENLSMHGLCRRAAGKDTAEGGGEESG